MRGAASTTVITASDRAPNPDAGDFSMTNHQSYRSESSLHKKTRSLLSVRKIALMASVVAGLGFTANSLNPSFGDFGFSTAAHARTAAVAQPTSFADMVERVKPSVFSVKVTMKEKTADVDGKNDESPDSQM